MGLQGMINSLVKDCDKDVWEMDPRPVEKITKKLDANHPLEIARAITYLERANAAPEEELAIRDWSEKKLKTVTKAIPVVGITGTGGSGKSSLCDELIRRFLNDNENSRVGVISVDPTRKRTGGALFGDRIRMNAAVGNRVYMRSLATQARHGNYKMFPTRSSFSKR